MREYKGQKFQVLGFPCNQFGLQEPGDNYTEIMNSLFYVRPGSKTGTKATIGEPLEPVGDGFKPHFQLFQKTNVNGENSTYHTGADYPVVNKNHTTEDPIFTYLKSRCAAPRKYFDPTYELIYEPKKANDIRWNFEKFLIDQNGKPVQRYAPEVDPARISPHIKQLLKSGPIPDPPTWEPPPPPTWY